MRVNYQNIIYSLRHPIKTILYLIRRDRIAYHTIAKYLPDNPVIIEAGAADGKNTQEMLCYWPKCLIYAFEPVPSAKAILDKIYVHEKRVSLYPYALADKCEFQEMHISGSSASETQSSSTFRQL